MVMTKYYVDPAGNYTPPYGGWNDGNPAIPGDAVEVSGPPPINASQVWQFPGWGPAIATDNIAVEEQRTDKSAGVISENKTIGWNSSDADAEYSNTYTTVIDNTSGSEDGCIVVETAQAGTKTKVASFEKGVTLGTATGGDQGVGSINASSIHIDGGTAIESGANKGFKTVNEQVYTSPGDFTPGSTTNLAMPVASVGDNEANVQVFFMGLEQMNTEWNIAGTSITFTSAIPVGVTSLTIKVLT